MSAEIVELSFIVFGMIVANVTWYLLSREPAPPPRMAQVVELARYRRRR